MSERVSQVIVNEVGRQGRASADLITVPKRRSRRANRIALAAASVTAVSMFATRAAHAAPSKSASLVCSVRDGRIIATRINGLYWLYYGEGTIHLLTSPDLHNWTSVNGFSMTPRPGLFDSGLAECGPPALLTSKGIVLLYNGKNAGADKGDPKLKPGVYADGQALFDAKDPTRLLSRPEAPFFQPQFPWEATGQYAAGTTFIEGLVLFHNKWFLYYGCADSNVGVAIADVKATDIARSTDSAISTPPHALPQP